MTGFLYENWGFSKFCSIDIGELVLGEPDTWSGLPVSGNRFEVSRSDIAGGGIFRGVNFGIREGLVGFLVDVFMVIFVGVLVRVPESVGVVMGFFAGFFVGLSIGFLVESPDVVSCRFLGRDLGGALGGALGGVGGGVLQDFCGVSGKNFNRELGE